MSNVTVSSLGRCLDYRQSILFVYGLEQASHNGELAHAVEAGLLGRDDVTELGAVLAGLAPGRGSDEEITAFDSTGLAIQDLAIALAAIEHAEKLELPARQPGDEVLEHLLNWLGRLLDGGELGVEREVAEAAGEDPALVVLVPVVEAVAAVVRKVEESLPNRLGGDHLAAGRDDQAF